MMVIKQYMKSKYENNVRILFTGSFNKHIMTIDVGLLKALLRLKGVKNAKQIDDIVIKTMER